MDFTKEIKRRFLLQEEYLGTDKPVNKLAPLVSVSVAAYQHENYIKQCLDGILMQQTNFPFEIIIGEDDSKDNTRAICIEYANKYPDKIRLFLRDRELSHLYDDKGNFVKRLNGVLGFGRMSARGKYIALCEGDDYWIDSLKLQKQVDFLETNNDYGLVHTDVNVYHQNTKKFINSIIKLRKRNLVQLDNPAEGIILGTYRVYTLTTLFRSSLFDKVNYYELIKFKIGDLSLWLSLSKFTKFYYINEATAVYRKTQGSASNPVQKSSKLDFKISSKKVRLLFAESLNLKTSTINEVSDRYNRAVLRKKYEVNESNQAFEAFISIKKKTFKDVILLLGCKSKIFKSMIKKTKPNMS